uniref:hypothetical protein n=1 Tax=Emticicia sp. 17c TaxID=3127704 RepID=UPI00301BB8DA
MTDYIYCREYGLQPVIWNYNFGRSEARDYPLVIINQSAPKGTPLWTGSIEYKPENEIIALNRVLYSKLITLSDFNGYDHIYVGKKSDFYFQNVAFDFVNDKWKIRNLSHPMNNYKFNVWDREHIKNILNNFLTKQKEEVFNLFYTEIYKSDGLNRSLRILESVIELKDDFLKLLVPAEQQFLDTPEGFDGGTKSPPKTS